MIIDHQFSIIVLQVHWFSTITTFYTNNSSAYDKIYGESLSTSNRMRKKRKKKDMRYGDLVMYFVIFQGTRFYDASMQKNCSGVGGEYEFSMA